MCDRNYARPAVLRYTMLFPAQLSQYASNFIGQRTNLILGIRCIRFLTGLDRGSPGLAKPELSTSRSLAFPPSPPVLSYLPTRPPALQRTLPSLAVPAQAERYERLVRTRVSLAHLARESARPCVAGMRACAPRELPLARRLTSSFSLFLPLCLPFFSAASLPLKSTVKLTPLNQAIRVDVERLVSVAS